MSIEFLKTRLDKANLDKLISLDNPAVYDFVAEFIKLCNPKSVFVRTDSAQDVA